MARWLRSADGCGPCPQPCPQSCCQAAVSRGVRGAWGVPRAPQALPCSAQAKVASHVVSSGRWALWAGQCSDGRCGGRWGGGQWALWAVQWAVRAGSGHCGQCRGQWGGQRAGWAAWLTVGCAGLLLHLLQHLPCQEIAGCIQAPPVASASPGVPSAERGSFWGSKETHPGPRAITSPQGQPTAPPGVQPVGGHWVLWESDHRGAGA